ncbi:nitroreductase family protein [bacterium]|nr:nitroreductase family protein [bacterium]
MFSQNIALQAVALGLAIVMVGTFKEVRKALKVEEQIKPLYIIPIGTPA